MEIYVDCECGDRLVITSSYTLSNSIILTVCTCTSCADNSYEAGEADAAQTK